MRPRSSHSPVQHTSEPTAHIVQFYEDEGLLIEAVGRFLSPALAAKDSAVVLATAKHREALANELTARGVEINAAKNEGRYIALDAGEMLGQFMVEGWPDEARFRAAIAPVIVRARNLSHGEGQVAAFGEMVALLWEEGKREAAVRLEQLWNRLPEAQPFSLFCGYPISGFERKEDQQLFFSICGEHSQVNPTESYPAEGTEGQRRRAVAKLQQKNRALETEIRLGQQRVLMVQRATGIGTWEMDLHEETMTFSSRAADLLGMTRGGFIRLEQFLSLMYWSGDRENFLVALKRGSTGRKEFVTEFRINRRGEARVISLRGRTVYNKGQSIVLGVVSDVTPAIRQAA